MYCASVTRLISSSSSISLRYSVCSVSVTKFEVKYDYVDHSLNIHCMQKKILLTFFSYISVENV